MADNKNNDFELDRIISEAMSAKKRRQSGTSPAAGEKDKPRTDTASSDTAGDITKKKAAAASAEIPDISLGQPKHKPAEHKPAEDKPAEAKPAPVREPEKADQPVKKTAAPAGAEEVKREKKPSDAQSRREPQRSRDGQRKASGSRSANAAQRSGNGQKKSSDGQKQGSGKKSKSGGKKKKHWTKKQITVMAVLIVVIIVLLLGFAVYLIFSHYYNMLGGKWNESVTSSRMEMSIDDSTQSDTFDSETAEDKLKRQLEEMSVDLMKDKDVFNVLLVGQDLRSTADEDRGNTDVMLLISLNRRTRKITMTSFMRDMWLYIPPCNYSDRLNAAYYAGGPEYLEETIESYFGVAIDRYVIVTFNQFIDIVETLGGLDLYVTPDEANGYQSANPYGDNTRGMQNPLDEQNYILGNPKGTDYIEMSYDTDGETLHLNGNQALAYSRIRHVSYIDSDGMEWGVDFGRTKRQRIVISKIIEKAKNASLSTLNDLAEKILPQTYTDIEKGEAASLLLNVFDYVTYDVQEMRIPAEGTYFGHWIDGKSVILCDTITNAKQLQELVYGETNIDEEKLRKYAEQNKYLDDDGNWIDWYDGNGVIWRNTPW